MNIDLNLGLTERGIQERMAQPSVSASQGRVFPHFVLVADR